MNKVIEIGRLTKDPDVRYSQGENSTAIAKYTLAVDRKFKREGEPTADFIQCVAIGHNGEFAEKYLRKGTKIGVVGRIQTGSYKDKDDNTHYTTEVFVEEHEFVESKSSNDNSENTQAETTNTDSDGFMNIPDGIQEELPFK